MSGHLIISMDNGIMETSDRKKWKGISWPNVFGIDCEILEEHYGFI